MDNIRINHKNIAIGFLGLCSIPEGAFTIKEFLAFNHATVTRELQIKCQNFFNGEVTDGQCVKGKRGNQSTYCYDTTPTLATTSDTAFTTSSGKTIEIKAMNKNWMRHELYGNNDKKCEIEFGYYAQYPFLYIWKTTRGYQVRCFAKAIKTEDLQQIFRGTKFPEAILYTVVI